MKRYAYRVGIAFDQLVNAVAGGYPNETLSARAWRHGEMEGNQPWRHFRCMIDTILWFDPNHCENSHKNTQRLKKNVDHYLPIHVTGTYINGDIPRLYPIDYVDPDDF